MGNDLSIYSKLLHFPKKLKRTPSQLDRLPSRIFTLPIRGSIQRMVVDHQHRAIGAMLNSQAESDLQFNKVRFAGPIKQIAAHDWLHT